MKWCDILPQLIEPERCTAISPDGHRCKRMAKIEDSYHGDNELYTNDQIDWVRIAFCDKHYEAHNSTEYKRIKPIR